ncbi:PREDICTED: uncharacterized protein LOC106812928 [Priapulus caudatus]|uniref:Uncharacterized protein LOC106812928 n=1 Tax=Priapulus caudatus TaxID=37621 RepID=A0ABM1EJQ3_PRICU|nr:PREDICTED: uncharacterized protein LOC106812928 [Priapulus caudatus]
MRIISLYAPHIYIYIIILYHYLRRQHHLLRRQHQLLRRQYHLLRRQHQLLRRQHHLLRRQHQLLRRQHQLLRRQHQLLRRQHHLLLKLAQKDTQWGTLDTALFASKTSNSRRAWLRIELGGYNRRQSLPSQSSKLESPEHSKRRWQESKQNGLHGCLSISNTSGQDSTRRFNADQDIQVLMDFIGSQPTATQMFVVRESSRESPALESTLKGSSLSHYGLTRSVVLHVYWLSDTEARDLQQSEEQPDLPTANSSPPTSTQEESTADDSDDEPLVVDDSSLERPTSPLAQLVQECNARLSGRAGYMHQWRDAAIRQHA